MSIVSYRSTNDINDYMADFGRFGNYFRLLRLGLDHGFQITL